MFLKKAISYTYLKKNIVDKRLNINLKTLKEFTTFQKIEIPPHQKYLKANPNMSYIIDREMLSSICKVDNKLFQKYDHLENIYKSNKDSKEKFVFNTSYLQEAKLEQLLNYHLYNHEYFSQDQLDYFLYIFCTRCELSNRITIKLKDLDQHKSVSLIWDYFLKNYKKIDNFDDCNKFLFLFYIYFQKFSNNKNDFMGKYLKKNNIKFFQNTIFKYLKISYSQVSIGKLFNVLTILGEFRSLNYYDYLKNREDEVEKLPYWTLRKMIVRVNKDTRTEKSLRQLINLIINPLTRDLTSIDILEKSFLLKHLSYLDYRLILISSTKKLRYQLYEDIMSHLQEVPIENLVNTENLKIFLNVCQSVRVNDGFLEDGRVFKFFEKILNNYETYKQKEKLKAEIDKYSEDIKIEILSSKNKQNSVAETHQNNQEKEQIRKEVEKKDVYDKVQISNINFISKTGYSINEDQKLDSNNISNKDDFFFEDTEELSKLDLELRIMKKKEDEELEFLDSFSLKDSQATEKFNSKLDIFDKSSELGKYFFEEQDNLNNDKNDKGLAINMNNEQNSSHTFNDLLSSNKNQINGYISQKDMDNKNLNKNQFNKDSSSLESMIDVIGYYYLIIFHQVAYFKHPSFSDNKENALAMLSIIKKVLFEMDIVFVKEKIKVNIIFDAFWIMKDHDIVDKEFFSYLTENFLENMIDNVIIKPFISFIHWTDKHLTVEEKKIFFNKVTKLLLERLTKDYSIFNFFRVTSLICSLNRKRTNLTDNLHFELISFIETESKINIMIKLFADYFKGLFSEVHIDYTRNLVGYLLSNIKIKDINHFSNQPTKYDFYFALLSLDLKNFDPEIDKKLLENRQKIINYLESTSHFEVEFSNVVKFFYKSMEKYRSENAEIALDLFLDKVLDFITKKNVLILMDIDRYMIYFALHFIQKERKINLIRKAVNICDLIYEETKTALDLNLNESITALEKLLEFNIVCKNLVKNFLVNIQIFKKLKETENIKLDDQSTFDINLINFKYQNVERNKEIINELLEKLKDNEIISEELYNISVMN